MKSFGFIQRLTKGLLYLRPKSWRSLQPLQLLAIREKSLFLSRLETIVLYAFRRWLWMCPIYDMPPSGSSLSICLIIAYGFNICKKSPGRHDCRDLILFYEHLPFGMGDILLRCKPYYSIRSPALTQPGRRQAGSISGVRAVGRAMATRARSSQSMPQRWAEKMMK